MGPEPRTLYHVLSCYTEYSNPATHIQRSRQYSIVKEADILLSEVRSAIVWYGAAIS